MRSHTGFRFTRVEKTTQKTFGRVDLLAKTVEAPAQTNTISVMIFNNLWHTNFVDNAMGEMGFSFDLKWQPKIAEETHIPDIADTLVGEPVLLLNPDKPADTLYKKIYFQTLIALVPHAQTWHAPRCLRR